jgi:hypothetical protein
MFYSEVVELLQSFWSPPWMPIIWMRPILLLRLLRVRIRNKNNSGSLGRPTNYWSLTEYRVGIVLHSFEDWALNSAIIDSVSTEIVTRRARVPRWLRPQDFVICIWPRPCSLTPNKHRIPSARLCSFVYPCVHLAGRSSEIAVRYLQNDSRQQQRRPNLDQRSSGGWRTRSW